MDKKKQIFKDLSITALFFEEIELLNKSEKIISKKVYSKKHNGVIAVTKCHKDVIRLI